MADCHMCDKEAFCRVASELGSEELNGWMVACVSLACKGLGDFFNTLSL